jgi:hypothetical protein
MRKLDAHIVILVIFSFTLATNNSAAQPSFQFNAFAPCIDTDGKESLCAQESWTIAESFSPEGHSLPASLENHFFTVDSLNEACENSRIPAFLDISLGSLRPVIGDRIYFEDIIIEAFDENSEFLSTLPIHVSALSQDGMLKAHQDWDYVEVSSFGHAMLIVNFYCDQLAEVFGSFNFSVAP